VNTLSLGTLAKEKGSFGSLYGSGATKAMGYASGGAVTREGQEAVGGVITRTGGKKAISRTFEIPMSPLNPGSSVGGQMNYVDPDTKEQTKISNIETFFPNPKDSKYINSYEYLTGSYNVVSSGEFLKPFLQMPIKIIMGNGSSEGDYNSLASSVNSLFVTILRRTLVPGARKSLADELGFVDIFSWARDSIRVSMIDPVNEILKSLKEQFMLKSGDGPGLVKDAAAGAESGAESGAETGGIQDASISAGEMDLFVRMVYAESGGEGKTGMALVARAILNRAGLIQSGKVGPGTFNAKSGSITDVINGRGQFSPITDGRINQKLSDSQINQSKNAITLAQKPSELMTTLKSEGLDDASIKKLVAATGFRTGAAFNDPSQNVNVSKYKNHYFNTAGNRALAVPQAVAISKEESSANMKNIQSISHPDTGSGYTVAGLKDQQGRPAVFSQKAADAFGRMMSDSKGVVRGSDIASSQRSRQKNAAVGGVSNSNHLYGNALDIHGSSQTWMRRNGKKYGWIVNDYDGSHGGHFDFKGYKEGGPVNKTDYALTHPGEYVVDADSVKLFGIQFYDIINKVEMVSQRKNASNMLISILSQYTEDGFPETEDDYEYPVPPPQVIMIPGPVFETASSSGSGSGGGGENEDTSQDGTELH
jgi:spore germination cell wall hydrolase CwlJ-like protein